MNPQLTTRLRHLRLSGMVEALPGRVAQAEAAPLPHLEFLELLVEDELARRADRLFARRLKQAGITVVKALADFDWSFNPKIPKAKIVELASARFVRAHDGVLLIDRQASANRTSPRPSPSAPFGPGAARSSGALSIWRPISPRRTRPAPDVISCSNSRASTCSSSKTSA